MEWNSSQLSYFWSHKFKSTRTERTLDATSCRGLCNRFSVLQSTHPFHDERLRSYAEATRSQREQNIRDSSPSPLSSADFIIPNTEDFPFLFVVGRIPNRDTESVGCECYKDRRVRGTLAVGDGTPYIRDGGRITGCIIRWEFSPHIMCLNL